MDYYTISKILTVILVFVTMCSAYTTYRLRVISMFLAYRLKECVQTNDKRLELLALQSQSANMLNNILSEDEDTLQSSASRTPQLKPLLSSITEEEKDSLDRYFVKESVLLPHTTGV